MRSGLIIVLLITLYACGQKRSAPEGNDVKTDSTSEADGGWLLGDTSVDFLWRKTVYDPVFKDSISSIFINETYCSKISEQEKAALAFVGTFIGNECYWDEGSGNERNNLKCKILTALDLGYQCSDRHLGFLQRWFRDDSKALEELEDCPTTPDGATVQDTFEKITLTIKGNKIRIWYSAESVNLREGESWTWSEIDHFEYGKDQVKLLKKIKSDVSYERGEGM